MQATLQTAVEHLTTFTFTPKTTEERAVWDQSLVIKCGYPTRSTGLVFRSVLACNGSCIGASTLKSPFGGLTITQVMLDIISQNVWLLLQRIFKALALLLLLLGVLHTTTLGAVFLPTSIRLYTAYCLLEAPQVSCNIQKQTANVFCSHSTLWTKI